MQDTSTSQSTTTSQTTSSHVADWDMTPYFSGVAGADYRGFRAALDDDAAGLAKRSAELPSLAASTRRAWCAFIVAFEALAARLHHVSSYLGCVAAADATDEAIQREVASLASLGAKIEKLYVAIELALAAVPADEVDALLASPELVDVAYFVRRMGERGRQRMAPELEALSSDLGVDGLAAWGRLYSQVTGTMTFTLALPEQAPKVLPVAMVRTYLEDADPAARKAALDGSAKAFEAHADVMAACLNAISGTRLTLYARRGIDDFLAPPLFDAGIERSTLEAMLRAIRARQDVPRAYLARKATILGLERLGFQDLMAPFPVAHEERLTWEQGRERVLAAFSSTYPALADFARRAFEGRWIDHSPRPGKRPGGFCSDSPISKQSRIFMTYHGAGGDVQTLAHELGHAFHSYVMREMRPWAQSYPMTLAETASTFAEQVVLEATLSSPEASREAKLAILDHRLSEAAVFLLNIPMRFDFEVELYRRRANGELSVSELKALMLDAQRKNYGEILDPAQMDPWFWASKLHYYITELSFYNFPYAFGYLFSLGLFARTKTEGPAFLPRYEALLRTTGSATAEEVARTALGVELGDEAFWNASIDLIAADLERFEQALAER